MKKQFIITFIIFLAVFAYAVIRYNVIKGTPWVELPLFISNKAISLSAVVFIALSYALGSLARFWPKRFVGALSLRKFFGLLGFALASLHGLISLLILSPAHYPKLFLSTGKLNLVGELSMLFGVLAFFMFTIVALTSIPAIAKSMDPERWLAVQRLGYFALLLVFFHVLVMGYEGWLNIKDWPGGLLPISLVAAIFIAFTLFLKVTATVFLKEAHDPKT